MSSPRLRTVEAISVRRAECVSPRGLACGVDFVRLDAIARGIEIGGEHFLQDIFTPSEQAYCRGRLAQLAGRFAAKEAVAKALGTGIRGIGWLDVEIISNRWGQPKVRLNGPAAIRAERMGLRTWAISISHGEVDAIAFVVAGRGSDVQQRRVALSRLGAGDHRRTRVKPRLASARRKSD